VVRKRSTSNRIGQEGEKPERNAFFTGMHPRRTVLPQNSPF
jgi:hypothetical protein